MKTELRSQHAVKLAAVVGPEDLQRGEFVAVLHEILEYPSFLWDGGSASDNPSVPVRIQWQPSDDGLPLKIKSICLPFVFVEEPCGTHRTLDVRQCGLARLDRHYAREVRTALRRVQRSEAKTSRREAKSER